MTNTDWTYESYCNSVLCCSPRSIPEMIHAFDLVEEGLDEWLGQAEAEAWSIGKGEGAIPESWSEHHVRALVDLRKAIRRSALPAWCTEADSFEVSVPGDTVEDGHDTIESAESVILRIYPGAHIEHFADRALAWLTEADSVNDAGAKAIASIRPIYDTDEDECL